MVARHFVLVPGPDGSVLRAPLKSWLREHPEVLPGVDPALTSHRLRSLLRHAGWAVEVGADEVLVISPAVPAKQVADFVTALEAESDADTEAGDDESLSFELEHQLRDFIIANLGAILIDGRRLRLYQDASGKTGREYPTGVGFIDILAQDDAGVFYVFELKRGKSADHTVGQILRYIGWLKHHHPANAGVCGVIVAKALSEKLKYAVSAVPGLYAYTYEVSFSLKPGTLL